MGPTVREITRAGYSVLKSECTTEDLQKIRHDLIVKPATPSGKTFAGKEVPSFPVFTETTTQFIVPKYWGEATWGPATCKLQTGSQMQTGLKFAGELREKQIDIVGSFMKEGSNGMICVPCGVGKTFMAIYIAYKLGLKTAVVVHKHFLLDQWRGEIERFLPEARIGYLYADIIDIEDKDIVIMMLQSITRDKYPDEFFDDIGFVIWDECHHLGAEVFSRAMRILNAKNMLGLSATPKRADGLDKILGWYFGPFAVHAKRRDMIRVIRYHYESDNAKYKAEPMTMAREPNRPVIINNIAGYQPRNNYILECVKPLAELGRAVLILSGRRDQLTYFDKAIRDACWKKADGSNVQVGFYVGGMKQHDLDASAECDVILGTYEMASEGMNIKKLNTIVLATSKKDVEQTVGRIMRELVEERVTVHVCLDFNDPHACLQGQQNARRSFYKSNDYEILEMPMNSENRFNMDMILKPLPKIKTELEITIKKGPKKVIRPVPKPFGMPLTYSESIDPEYLDAPWLSHMGKTESHEEIGIPAGFVQEPAEDYEDNLETIPDTCPIDKDDDWGDAAPPVEMCPIEKDDDDWGDVAAQPLQKTIKVAPRSTEAALPAAKGVVKVVPRSTEAALPVGKGIVKVVPRSTEAALPAAKGVVKVVPRSTEAALPVAKGVVKVVPRSTEAALPPSKIVKVVSSEVTIVKRRKPTDE